MIMQETNKPIRLLDYAYEYVSQLRCLIVSNIYELHNRTTYEIVHGYTPDISEFVMCCWYQWIWYYDSINIQRHKLGRWIGIYHT